MKTYIGMWVDLKKACIVTFVKQGTGMTIEEEGSRPLVEYVSSDIEKRVRPSGGSRSKRTPLGPEEISDEKKKDRKRDQEKANYFKEIISRLKNANHVLVFGPGEAKKDLLKEIKVQNKMLAPKVVVDTADKMTENQIVARVRDYFGL